MEQEMVGRVPFDEISNCHRFYSLAPFSTIQRCRPLLQTIRESILRSVFSETFDFAVGI